jgi:hypothetical protein
VTIGRVTRVTPFVEARVGVLAAPLNERDARAPATAPAGTPWGRLACRDLGRYYAALHQLQQCLPVTELELAVIGHALREAPGPLGRVAVDGSDLCVLWHTVERACRGGPAGRYGVDAARRSRGA